MLDTAIDLMERGYVPDWLTRIGIRRLLAERLRGEATDDRSREAVLARLEAELRASPIALHTGAANQQHYEVPAEFFQKVLGPRLKYSSCWWPEEVKDLETAEAAMLALTCERAELGFDQDILELGCGWGSLTLWMAELYPDSRIVAVSNSRSQREFIEARCRERGFGNVQAITADMNDFSIDRRFDRVVSVEMFEHMRNYQELMARIHAWLKPGGKLFVHIFTHRQLAYPFETEGEDNWMGRYFFTGGLMPSRDLLPRFQGDLKLEEQWHFERSPLPAHPGSLAGQPGPASGRDHGAVSGELRPRTGGTLVPALAGVFHGLRRAVRLPPRRGMGRVALPLRQARLNEQD